MLVLARGNSEQPDGGTEPSNATLPQDLKSNFTIPLPQICSNPLEGDFNRLYSYRYLN